MLIKKPNDIPSSEITPKSAFLSRRKFITGAVAAGAAVAGGFYLRSSDGAEAGPGSVEASGQKLAGIRKSPFSTTEKPTSFKDITNYNNYYEFSTDKYRPAALSANFRTRPWTVALDGMVKKPKTLDIDAILKLAPLEERIYRHRCVEGWSMVIPWVGFPLSELIKQADPLPSAKFVAFQTILAPDQMPGQKGDVLPWPYVEGLRMDEAMHPLTILVAGLYDEVLPNVDGAPLRLAVPWKYGFKSIKAIVKVSFTDKMPPTTWNIMASNEYGFYSNVNPTVDHPRWSQATERRIGGSIFAPKIKTLMFNGYADQVAGLYTGMDLRKNF
ncbi:MAG TPA: protein-methionine-sulfoxide reductase catalytic subunit MsrP [Candidatus Limnocylindrales bacterium]|nr:protein-methionine-sulfoxide reductase catalytic subunit MsrP [Candidatus Limnocylindrales bacterium]